MRHRIHVPEVQTAGDVTVTGDEFHHAARVVRVREGEEVELFDGRGRMVSGKVSALARDHITVAVEREIPSRESPLRITLAMAIIQLEKFELVLQKATELGAHALIPLITDRAEVRPERYRGKVERWQKIIFEAVKQSGRALVPAIAEPISFDDALHLRDGGLRIIFDADADSSPELPPESPTTLFIGPEGGWSERELGLARAAGCRFGRLGPRRLRAETAAIVAFAVTAARSGDLR